MIFKILFLFIYCLVFLWKQIKKIKEKLKFILRSEKTTKFLDASSSLKYVINNSVGNTNNFIDNVFGDEENIDIELTNSLCKIDNIIIFDKRIMIRTLSFTTTNFVFKSFKFRKEFDINEVLKDVKIKLNFFDYIFFIRIDRNMKNKPFKVLYNFHLIPISFFNLNKNYWYIQANKQFCLLINSYVLDKFSLDYAYSYNY